MKRLKGLDEMPVRTGLEIEWSPDRPGAYSSRSIDPSRAGTSLRNRIVSLALACMVVTGGVYVIGLGFVPSADQIGREMDRRWRTLVNNRNDGGEMGAAIRPAVEDVTAAIREEESRTGDAGVRTFPAGAVEYSEVSGSDETPIDFLDATGNGLPKVIRIKDLANERVRLTAYLSADGTMRVTLPPGGYRILIAQGSSWYGTNEQFRKYGTYFEPQNLDVRQGQRLKVEFPPASSDAVLEIASVEEF